MLYRNIKTNEIVAVHNPICVSYTGVFEIKEFLTRLNILTFSITREVVKDEKFVLVFIDHDTKRKFYGHDGDILIVDSTRYFVISKKEFEDSYLSTTFEEINNNFKSATSLLLKIITFGLGEKLEDDTKVFLSKLIRK